MYKTIWSIVDGGENKTELTYYHFGKEPKFPAWYMEEDNMYEIKMDWNVKLIRTPEMFFKCLFHKYIIRSKNF